MESGETVTEPSTKPIVVTVAKPPAKPAWDFEKAPTTVNPLFEAATLVFCCDYCDVSCNSENQLNTHCSSAKHKLNVNSDKERKWNFRPPPRDVLGGNYRLCQRLH